VIRFLRAQHAPVVRLAIPISNEREFRLLLHLLYFVEVGNCTTLDEDD
jgi:hypothetical protein